MFRLIPKELLDYLLEGNTLKPDELDQFIQENPDENQYLDYKNGAITNRQQRDKGTRTIREYVSGFANSDGGVLMIGIDEARPRQIAPCEQLPGGQSLNDWASRCLHDMVGYFSPQPRFHTIPHPQGHVLAIAVARAPSLVPCVESRELKYFFRIGDSTLPMPEWLIADLVLGKRQHPLLDLHDPHVTDEGLHQLTDQHGRNFTSGRRIIFSFIVENLSLATADDVKSGVVLWSLGDGPTEDINRHLRVYLDIEDISPQFTHYQFHLVHRSSVSSGKNFDLEPFQKRMMQNIGPFYFPQHVPVSIVGAVYVISRGAPPIWFQLEGTYREGLGGDVVVKRKGAGRPQVRYNAPALWRKA